MKKNYKILLCLVILTPLHRYGQQNNQNTNKMKKTFTFLLLFTLFNLMSIAQETGINDFRISSVGTDGTSQDAYNPVIAYNSTDNQYLVVWEDNGIGSEYEIWGQLINAATGAEIGSDFEISDMGTDVSTTFYGKNPSVTYNATDNEFLVVWEGKDETIIDVRYYFESEIFGQRISADGSEIGTNDFVISDIGEVNWEGDAYEPKVVWNSVSNEYLVIFRGDDFGRDGGGTTLSEEFEIFGQRLDNTGNEIGTNDFLISDMYGLKVDGGVDAYFPDVAYNSTNNEYLVVWRSTESLTNLDLEIYAQRLGANGSELGTNDFVISDMGPANDNSFEASAPSIAYNATNNEYLVVWYGDDLGTSGAYEIHGQRLSNAGAELGTNDFRISDMGTSDANSNLSAYYPNIAYASSTNEYFVVWYGDDDTAPLVDGEWEVFGQIIKGSDGSEIGSDVRISDMGVDGDGVYDGKDNSVVFNSTDAELMVVWEGDDAVNGSYEIFGQLFSIAAASAPPTLTTTAASDITATSATLGGDVTSDGGASVTERGVVYSTTDDTPTIGEAGVTKDANGSGTGAFFESIGSLDVNTTYYYNAYATNSEGTSYGIASSFTTLKLSQTITFGALPVKTYGDADFAPGATASSGLTVTYSSSNTAVATIVSGQIHIAGAGSCTIYADQAGNDTYYAASQESQSLTINKATPTVTAWPTAAGITYGDDLSSAALSGGTASVAGSFAYDDNTIIPELGVYNAALTFTPTDAGNYNTVSGNINVTVYNLATVTTIAATELAAKTVTINGIVNANNASTDVTFEYGLTTSYGTTIAAVQSPVEGTTNTDVNADISGLTPNTTYHYRVVGINTVGTSNGDDQTFTTSKYDQVITFAELPDKTTNDPDFDAGATSDLGLDVAYASSNEQVATIVSGLIHIVGAGTTDITASQEGNDTVNVAIPVIQSLTVTQATGLESKEYTEFKMYPNPVRDYLSIDIGNQNVSNVEISIIDISGKIVHSKNYNNTVNTIDVSNYNSGLYFVEVKTANAIQKLKLLIE